MKVPALNPAKLADKTFCAVVKVPIAKGTQRVLQRLFNRFQATDVTRTTFSITKGKCTQC
ncbi:hypothetical protein RchiOBHm_Chr2g0085381 [Rosa chinensis]|uniref:Uncharacterized protein n=1 Tax=Rosa chinensis TaxID=74649 RepID=A0A2P6RI40_ROSCH|nr:hypothetical protein RchiOBHm_Chr2g0085381 [Rosa chinensis]